MRPAFVLLLCAAPVAAQEAAPPPPPPRPVPRWDFFVGHSYSSSRALLQPATFALEQERGAPLYSVLDAGALVRGSLTRRTWLELGVRARAGSARPPSQRVYGVVARVYGELDPVLVALGAEHEADGHFDVQTTAGTLELTPLGGLPGLGTWVSPAVHLRWRPWLGVAAGSDVRPYGRLAAEYALGRVEGGLEATTWLVSGSANGFVRGDVSVALVGGLFATASGEIGRPPPRFEASGRFGIGLGFRLRPAP